MRSARNEVAPHGVLLPGFNGSANQPVLLRIAAALEERGLSGLRMALPRGRPSPGLAREQAALFGVVTAESFLVGRSFGGRVAARYAVAHGARAVVLVGFPIRPPGTRRPDDEAALRALRCPTLVVQNEADPLGPLKVLKACVTKKANVSLHVVPQSGHGLAGRRLNEAADVIAEWLVAALSR
ncbi:MAG: hypothetical protein JNG84_11940 [Archangium sp.]|nr:hypothetical protein [Archangium sp.]